MKAMLKIEVKLIITLLLILLLSEVITGACSLLNIPNDLAVAGGFVLLIAASTFIPYALFRLWKGNTKHET